MKTIYVFILTMISIISTPAMACYEGKIKITVINNSEGLKAELTLDENRAKNYQAGYPKLKPQSITIKPGKSNSLKLETKECGATVNYGTGDYYLKIVDANNESTEICRLDYQMKGIGYSNMNILNYTKTTLRCNSDDDGETITIDEASKPNS